MSECGRPTALAVNRAIGVGKSVVWVYARRHTALGVDKTTRVRARVGLRNRVNRTIKLEPVLRVESG